MNVRNKVTLIGHLGQDPELGSTQSGDPYARFSLATNESFRNREGDLVEKTEWHKCIVWGKKAETAKKFLTKGKEIALEGTLRYRSYEDREGVRRYSTDIEVANFTMIGKKEPA
ncbi:MAG: single-stranded DNA-binding protein [Saprospiraceae bacterium]|nr:single-stranded DNA-binding protein [Saprospiraceae bacterium]